MSPYFESSIIHPLINSIDLRAFFLGSTALRPVTLLACLSPLTEVSFNAARGCLLPPYSSLESIPNRIYITN